MRISHPAMKAAIEARFTAVAGGGISFNVLTSGSGSFASQTLSTASVSPASNALVLAIIGIQWDNASGEETISVSGNGMTWDQVESITINQDSAARSMAIFRCMGSPSSGAVTFTDEELSGDATTGAYVVLEATGVVTGNNGADAISNIVSNDVNAAATSVGLTITGTPTGNDVTFGVCVIGDGPTLSSDALWAAIQTAASADASMTVDYDVDKDQTPTWTWTAGRQGGAIGMILEAA